MKINIIAASVLILLLLISCSGKTAKTDGQRYSNTPIQPSGENEFGFIYEAEDSEYKDNLFNTISRGKFSGKGFIGSFEKNPGSRADFYFHIDDEGFYEITVLASYPNGPKSNILSVNDESSVYFEHEQTHQFVPVPAGSHYLIKGTNKVSVTPSWGWFQLDAICVKKAQDTTLDFLNVSGKLVNPNAHENARRLMNFFADNYGKMIVTGQVAGRSLDPYDSLSSEEFIAIHKLTGEYPAILGLDFMDYSPSRVERGTRGTDTEKAIDFWVNHGGIPQFCWHWNAPKDLIDNDEHKWWSGFYTRATTFDLEKAMNGTDPEGYSLLLRDIDVIAAELKKLQDAGVPVLWRPLHEASGEWFWWGAKGPEPYKKLWILLYERLTNYHNLNNLIWVCNPQNKDWYPGDEYADMITIDIYAPNRSYGSHKSQFDELIEYTDNYKIIALSENGVVPDIDLLFRDNAVWSWYATWCGEFVLDSRGNLSEEKTENWVLQKMYSDPRSYKLSNLPDLKNYRID